MTILVVILLCVIAVVIGVYFNSKKFNQLETEGKVVRRDDNFHETEQIFTAVGASYERVEQELKNIDLADAKIKEQLYRNNGKAQILYRSTDGWNATLDLIGEDEGKYTYRFTFPVYTENNGSATRLITMNILLTAVEKMFLRIDPNTQVTSKKLKYRAQ